MEDKALVEKVAKRLDEIRPGWEEKVDVSVLDMIDSSRCVIGQVFDLKLEDWSAYSNVLENCFHPDHEVAFVCNKELWIEQIKGRLLLNELESQDSLVLV